jgi:hypothetical protein
MLGRVDFSIVERLKKTTDTKLNDYIFDWIINHNITLECLENEGNAEKILLDAIEANYLDAVIFFIQNKYVEPTVAGNSPLINAAIFGYLNIVKYLLIYDGLDIECAFCHAATEGHFEMVQYFLKNTDVNPAALENVSINSALEKGHVDVVLLLASQPTVIAALAKYKQNESLQELCQKVKELMKTVKSALNNYGNQTCLFFKYSTDENSILYYLLKELKLYIAGIGEGLIGKELKLSDKQLKNILSIKDILLSLEDERTSAEENTNQPK